MNLIRLRGLALVIINLFWLVDHTLAQGTAFTYQGRLNDANGPASGTYDFQFTLYLTNTDGQAIAGPISNSAVVVSNGLFLSAIDFGNAFNSTNYWLDIAVRTNDGGFFSELVPRQLITSAPTALFAETANTLSGFISATQLTGILPVAQIDPNGLRSLVATQVAQTVITSSIPAQNIIGLATNFPGIDCLIVMPYIPTPATLTNSSRYFGPWLGENYVQQAINSIARSSANINTVGGGKIWVVGQNYFANPLNINFPVVPSTNTITGAGTAAVNGNYLGFSTDTAMTAWGPNGYVLTGATSPYNASGYPMEIDDTNLDTLYFSTNGITWYTNSTTTGAGPPPAGSYTTIYTPAILSLSLESPAFSQGALVCAANPCIRLNQVEALNTLSLKNLIISSLDNSPTNLMEVGQGYPRLTIDSCWFGNWKQITNHATVFGQAGLTTTATDSGGGPHNLQLFIQGSVSDKCFMKDNIFLGIADIWCNQDHLDFIGNQFSFCGNRSGGTPANGWPNDSPEASGAVLLLKHQVDDNWNFQNNFFYQCTAAYYKEDASQQTKSYNDYFEGGTYSVLYSNSVAAINFVEINPAAAQGAGVPGIASVSNNTLVNGTNIPEQVLLNAPAARLPGSLLIGGTYYGNGSGLTGLSYSAISGAPAFGTVSSLSSNTVVNMATNSLGSAAWTTSTAYDAAGAAWNATNNTSFTRLGTNVLNNVTLTGPAALTLVTNSSGITAAIAINSQTNVTLTQLSTGNAYGLTNLQGGSIIGPVTNLPGNSSWTLINSNLLLNSTNYSTEPSTNITITGAGVTLANDIYFGFDPQMTNFSNQNVALSANGLFGIFGPGMNINGYPFEIDDTLFGTNYYYSTNGVVWYSASSVFNPPPMATVNFAGLLTNYTLLKVSIPGLRYNSIWNFGAKGGDNDDTAAFQAAAESGQIVSLDPSTNYTISNLTLPAGAHIEGQGAVVKVKSTMVGYAVTFNSAVNFINQPATVFHNVILDGGSYYPAWSFSGSNVISGANNVWRSGFYIGANLPNTDFSGCVAMNFQDRGFTFVGNFSAYPQPATGSTIANNIQAYNCWVGAEFVNSAEYFVGSGWQIKNCGHALHIFSGNDQLTGLNCTRNGIAVYITGAGYIDPNGVSKDNYSVANAAHGVVSGCLNHNGYAAWLSEFNQGFAFNNCTMQGGNVLNNIVMMTNVTGVTIYGGQPGTSQIIVNGTDANSGDNYYNWQGLSNYPSVYAYGTGKLHLISGLISELNGVFFTNGVALGAFAGNGSSLTNLNGPGIIGGAITNAISTPGNVTAAQIASTNGYFIATSGIITNPIAGGGLLWNSNNALYWITSTHTNYITGP